MENNHREVILDLLTTKAGEYKETTIHGIFVNGERIKVGSGKSAWKQKNHASCALTQYVSGFVYDWNGRYTYEDRKLFLAELDRLKKEGIIEIKPIF